MFRENLSLALVQASCRRARVCLADSGLDSGQQADHLLPAALQTFIRAGDRRVATGAISGSSFCTVVHSFPQPEFQIPLVKKNGRV